MIRDSSDSTPRVTHPVTLADWLAYQERLHPNTIDLGLERLQRVLARLDWQRPSCPIVTVGGTNGKGSCVAMLESILIAAGYRVGAFTSPHLIRYNERIRICGRDAGDAALVAAFKKIESARDDVSLTFFEFNALAALVIFAAEDLDVIVLEVGMGGRLDAVNVVDADVAIVSSIALDHCDWLGNNVESIAREKAGIFRKDRPAIFGSHEVPNMILSEARRIGAKLQRLGADFDVVLENGTWKWSGANHAMNRLPLPNLSGAVQFENAATVLAALDALRDRLVVDRRAIEKGLRNTALRGRFQVIHRHCEWILDVAHNPAAAQVLARNLAERSRQGRTIAVCGILGDKDSAGVVDSVCDQIDEWVLTDLVSARSLAAKALAGTVEQRNGRVAHIAADVKSACIFANSIARPADRIVVFGSFYTVGPALEWLEENRDT